jgi:predicted nucleotidyltransferase
MHFDIEECLIFETIVGSCAYGTNTLESDIDKKGICITPKNTYLSLFKNFNEYREDDPEDKVIYSLDKFMLLASKCNPTILELLFIEDNLWTMHCDMYLYLRENRDMFLSKKYVKNSFSGYAISQLKRMQRHKVWLDCPPTKPKLEDFNLTHDMFFGKDEIGSYDYLEDNGFKFSKDVVSFMSKVKGYKNKLKDWKHYCEWRENRNEERAKVEAQYGIDLKHLYHTVRLALQGQDLLLTGEMPIYNSPHKQLLIDIRNGKWSYEQALEFARSIDEKLNEAEANSVLPKSPDYDKIDEVFQVLCKWMWEETRGRHIYGN